MKRLSLLATVVAAALLGALVIGATSASATVLCKQAPVNNYCGAENIYPKGTSIQATLAPGSEVKFATATGLAYGRCSASAIDMTVSKSGGLGEEVQAVVNAHSFGECAAPIQVYDHPAEFDYMAGIRWTEGTHGGTIRSSTWFETNLPKAWGIPGQCIYDISAQVPIVPGANPQIAYKNSRAILIHLQSHWACDSEVFVTGTYNISTPTPLYVEKY